jgi:hypothetical protein
MTGSDPVSPRVFFRTMEDDFDGLPLCGDSTAQLGVRGGIDIDVDAEDNVHPDTGGMSAALDHPRYLPPHFRPRTLPGGRSTLPCFSIQEDDLGPSLEPRARKKHIGIEPATVMRVAAYQAELCHTKEAWRRWA